MPEKNEEKPASASASNEELNRRAHTHNLVQALDQYNGDEPLEIANLHLTPLTLVEIKAAAKGRGYTCAPIPGSSSGSWLFARE